MKFVLAVLFALGFAGSAAAFGGCTDRHESTTADITPIPPKAPTTGS
jgi:hypothetical protein